MMLFINFTEPTHYNQNNSKGQMMDSSNALNILKTICSRIMRPLVFLLLISLSQLAVAETGMQIIKSGADFNTGLFEEETIDIQVKTVGGYVKHRRYLNGGVWTFNPNWSDLVLTYKADDASMLPSGITRAGRYKYIKTSNSTTPTYVFKNEKFIVKTDEGYRWKDRFGNWIDYNNQGVMYSYGNKNAVVAYIKRDTGGHITEVENVHNEIILTYTYNDKNLLESVEDYTGRKVTYEYSDATSKLSGFTDAYGTIWSYSYHPEFSHLVSLREGSNDERVTINYVQNESTYCVDGTGGTWKFNEEKQEWEYLVKCNKWATSISPIELQKITRNNQISENSKFYYDKNKEEWTILTNFPDGRMTAITYNEDTEVIARVVNGRDVESTIITGNAYTIADENKNKTIIRKDAFKNPLEITYADGAKVKRTYNTEFSVPTLVIDENGNQTKYEYDTNGNLTQKTEAAGSANEIVTTYIYDEYGQGTQINYADGSIEKWAYDTNGNVASFTDASNHVTTYSNYDALGNPGKVTDPRGNFAEMQYDAVGNMTQYKTALGHISTYEYDDRGNLIKVTDAENQVTSLDYDSLNRPIKVTNPLGAFKQYEYNSRRQVTKVTDESGKITQIDYDLDGQVTKITDGNNNVTEADYGYLNLKPYKGRLNQINFPSYSSEYEYDKRYRITSTTDNAEGEAERNTRYGYDFTGNVTRITDPKGNQSTLEYDTHNRVVKFNDRAQQATQFQYDTNHNLSKVINAKNNEIRTYEYDSSDRLIKEILPDNAEYQTVYDANGNITQQIDAKGQVSIYEYDADNRLTTSRTFADISQITNNANAQKTTTYGYDNVGRLSSYDDGTTQGSYTYDGANRLLSFTVNYGSFSKTSSYTYYPNGKKKTFTGPDGQTITYGYDSNNQLQTVSIPGQGSITVNENNWILPKTVTYPGGIKQSLDYDGYLRAKAIKTSKTDNSALLEHQYQYDSIDNVTVQNILAGSRTGQSNYSYDNLDRLTQYNIPSLGAISASTIDLGYDELGNRITDSRDADPTTWQYDNRDRLTQRGKLTYDYDTNGSLISITHDDNGLQRSFVYNINNRLISVNNGQGQSISTYQYDPFGRRISKTVNNITTYYFNSAEGLVAEFSASGQISTQYGYRPDGLWGTNPLYIKQGGYTGYYQNDHLGTPQQIVSSSGQVLWQAHYSAFGSASVTTNTITNNLRLAGQYYDLESNLHYNFFRYYDPSIGRYVTSDPIGLQGGINTYGYVGGNPTNFIDPLGLSPAITLPARGGYLVGGRVIAPAIDKVLLYTVGVGSLGSVIYDLTHPNQSDLFNPPFVLNENSDESSGESCPVDGTDVVEEYDNLESCVGCQYPLDDVEFENKTKNPRLKGQGFTEKWTGRGPDGSWLSGFKNPKTGKWTGGHPSSRR